MALRLWMIAAAAWLLAMALPAARSLGDDRLSAVLDDFVEHLTESQRDPLWTALSESRVECVDDSDDDACRLVALRDYLLQSGSGGIPDSPADPAPAAPQ